MTQMTQNIKAYGVFKDRMDLGVCPLCCKGIDDNFVIMEDEQYGRVWMCSHHLKAEKREDPPWNLVTATEKEKKDYKFPNSNPLSIDSPLSL